MESVLAGTSVLVVDDDRDTLDLFSTQLQRVGATVRSAGSVEDALTVLAAWRPDVVLCDLHLPGTDGYGLLEAVRANPALTDLPVIAISGSHPDVERQKSLQAGFAEHLVKPARLREILDVVTAVVARSDRSARAGRDRDGALQRPA